MIDRKITVDVGPHILLHDLLEHFAFSNDSVPLRGETRIARNPLNTFRSGFVLAAKCRMLTMMARCSGDLLRCSNEKVLVNSLWCIKNGPCAVAMMLLVRLPIVTRNDRTVRHGLQSYVSSRRTANRT